MSGMRVVTAVRARPLSSSEVSSGAVNILSYDAVSKGIGVTHPSAVGKGGSSAAPERVFNFDYNFWSVYKADPYFSSQEDVFVQIGMPIIENCLQGMNCSLFAYGQTGSGKTYTMMGYGDADENLGLIPRICRAILRQLTSKDLNVEGSIERLLSAKVFVSFLEIYNEKIFDLLSSTSGVNSRVREHPQNGAYVENLTKVKADSYADILQILSDGKSKRQVASTLMNSESSRSHAVFTIYIVQQICSTTEFERSSKVSLVDLAGSERVNNSGVTGDRLKEATNINKSLSTLSDVINALSDKASGSENAFIPYRNSTLTWLLKDSLGGNSKTSMLATVSPADANYGESMSTLRYLERAKLIVNKVSINESHWENPQVSMLQKQLSELNTKYLALLKLHQLREAEFESTLARIQADLDSSSAAKVQELQRYVAHLENQLGLPQSTPSHGDLGKNIFGVTGVDQSDDAAIAEVETDLNRSLPFSEHGDIDPDDLLNKDELTLELEGAVSEMLSVVCGERVNLEDCATAASVFASVMDKHVQPMAEKYKKLLERHKLLEKWYAQEREIVNSKNSQLDELTGEITTLRRNVFRSQSFAEEPSLLATIQEGEYLLSEEGIDSYPFESPSIKMEGSKTGSLIQKLGDELAQAMINLQNTKRIMDEQAEIHTMEVQAVREEFKKSTEKLATIKAERDSMSNSVMEVNNARALLENDLKVMQKEMRQQNAKFSDRLMAKDNEIALLTDQVSTAQSGTIESENALKREIAVLESHLKAQTKAVMLLKAEKESAKQQYTRELDSTLMDTEASHAALRDELERMRSQVQVLTDELDDQKLDREADAKGLLDELEIVELKFTNAKKQWAADEDRLRSEIGYWVAELENLREEATTSIDELRDALMSQSEVHKKYESEKESEIGVLKTWLEEAQGDLEDIHKSKAQELELVNESTLKMKAELENQVNEKTARIDTMLENIDNLTRKCNKWDAAYESLRRKYDDLHAKYSEQEEARQLDLELAKEDYIRAMKERDCLIASTTANYTELLKEAEEKQARSNEALSQVREELSTQLVKYNMLELDEVTEVDALKTEIHDLEEKDEAKLKAVVEDKIKVAHNLQKLMDEFQTFQVESSAEIRKQQAEIESLHSNNDILQSKLEAADDRVKKLYVHQEERDLAHTAEVSGLSCEISIMSQCAAMAAEDMAAHQTLLEEARFRLQAVHLSALAAIAEVGSFQNADSPLKIAEKSEIGDTEAHFVVGALEYDEDSNYERNSPNHSGHSIADNEDPVNIEVINAAVAESTITIRDKECNIKSPDISMKDLASVILSFLVHESKGANLPQNASAHSFDSLSIGSETIDGLAITMVEGDDVADITAKKILAPEAKLTESVHMLEEVNKNIRERYESTISDIVEDYEAKSSALDIARNMQDEEINQLQEEVAVLKAELEKARAKASSAVDQNKSAPDARTVPPPVSQSKAKKKKSFWSCATVDENEVVDPTSELRR